MTADGSHTGVSITPVTEADFPALRELAGTIWRQHYTEIISTAQIDYMLTGRFNDEGLREYLAAEHKWLDLLRVSEHPVGYCSYEVANIPGDDVSPAAMKLGQLYVLESHRGTGLGKHMLSHVEVVSRDLKKSLLWLQVNKKNTLAIGFYRAMGFEVAREAVFDIGDGFMMDDYLMVKGI